MSGATRYVKKPLPVLGMEISRGNLHELIEFGTVDHVAYVRLDHFPAFVQVETLHGPIPAQVGDFVLCNPEAPEPDYWPVKRSTFEATYERYAPVELLK